MKQDKPKFKHDCALCVFLGHWAGADLYYCGPPDHAAETVIARFSDEGRNYISGLPFARTNRHLARALELAIDQGWMIDPQDRIDSIPEKARWQNEEI